MGTKRHHASLARAMRGRAERFVTIAFVLALAALASPPLRAGDGGTVLVMGDSLSAGYGLAADQGWVELLRARMAHTHEGWRVVNASISGETTAGGAARIDEALAAHEPDVVVIELGANDGLRGLPVDIANGNLAAMIEASHDAGAEVLLIGTELPPNYGREYTDAFRQMYAALAQRHEVALLPFLLAPIATERAAFQSDNLHPTAQAQPRLLEHVWPALEPLLD